MCYIDINDMDALLELRALQRKPMSIRAMRMAKAGGIRAAKTMQYRARYAEADTYGMRPVCLPVINEDEAWQLLYDGWLATAGTATDAAIWEAYRAKEDLG